MKTEKQTDAKKNEKAKQKKTNKKAVIDKPTLKKETKKSRKESIKAEKEAMKESKKEKQKNLKEDTKNSKKDVKQEKKKEAKKKKTPLEKDLKTVKKIMDEAKLYRHAASIANFDMETVCPKDGREEQGEVMAFLGNQAFKLIKKKKFIKAAESLYKNRGELEKYDAALVSELHRDYAKIKNITPEMQHKHSLVYNKAFVDWLEAKEKSDFSLFKNSLAAVRDAELEAISLREEAKENTYDNLLDDYERGMTSAKLDETFGQCKERLIPFLEKIKKSDKKIRTDFMSRPVPEEAQRRMTNYLLGLMQYDFNRGAVATTEHPFTDELGMNDVRITTHYHADRFASNMYTVIHEGGHALFGQNLPKAQYKHHLANGMTMGMHESVSRFYENRIGRSKAFVHLIYDKTKEIFPEAMKGVSEAELYEGLNLVQPSLIRTEADEFTYTFHVIIRYEIEKEIIAGTVKIEDLPCIWNEKYQSYLGVTPATDSEGVLQDVHWSGGFGYFPCYAIGNMYNSMYYNKMHDKYNIEELIEGGHIDIINDWMKKHVYKKAVMLDASEWIKDITGREFTPKDFLDYLEDKYGELYGI